MHELEVQYYIAQLISGAKCIHVHNIIHRDLKLGNLFLGNHLELKIGDFGLAAKLSHKRERRKTICGTPNYIAPEVLNSKVYGHSFEVDIWSIGVIIYTMLTGRPSSENKNLKLTYRKIKTNTYSISDELSSDAKSLISNILSVNPAHRLTVDDIMKHPFMTKNLISKYLHSNSLSSPLPEDFINQRFIERKRRSRRVLLTHSNSQPLFLDIHCKLFKHASPKLLLSINQH